MPPYFFALAPLGWAYSVVMSFRASMYRAGILRARRLPCRVVSVGNITAGGTGKTPMVAHIVGRLVGSGLRTAVLTRGYGGSREGETLVVSTGDEVLLGADESGDEPALLAGLLPGVPVVMGADRHAAGMLAVDRFSPDVVVLDDGFQHMALHRDLDILLMDARLPLGNGRVLPAGYLREPTDAARRADIVVLTRSGDVGPDVLEDSMALAGSVSGGRPVATSEHVPTRVRGVDEGAEKSPDFLSGKGVLAFCGIAEPASFALILKRLGANIIRFMEFGDHHAYTARELEDIRDSASELGADAVVTTEKDAVKLARLGGACEGIISVGIELRLTRGEEALDGLILEKVLKGING